MLHWGTSSDHNPIEVEVRRAHRRFGLDSERPVGKAAYAAASSADSVLDVRSRRVIRCTRISVTDFFAPSLATKLRVWISPMIWRWAPC